MKLAGNYYTYTKCKIYAKFHYRIYKRNSEEPNMDIQLTGCVGVGRNCPVEDRI
jgi:hypothetical protein